MLSIELFVFCDSKKTPILITTTSLTPRPSKGDLRGAGK